MSDSSGSRVLYVDCRVDVAAWKGLDAFECDDAEVRIEGDQVVVSYFDEEGMVVMEGRMEGQGAWSLMARSRPWRAFLAPMGDPPGVFVGEIDEHGEVTDWKLSLGPSPSRD